VESDHQVACSQASVTVESFCSGAAHGRSPAVG